MKQAFTLSMLILIFFLFPQKLWSGNMNNDEYTSVSEIDTNTININLKPNERIYNPHVAMLLSIVPGGGQIYNQSYWKLPIIYGGFAGLMYGYNYYNVRYQAFRKAYSIRIDDDAVDLDIFHPEAENNLIKYSTANQLLTQREFNRRNRDLMIISLSALYILNILDAYVDAHLKDFEIFDEVYLKVNPVNIVSIEGKNNIITGISLRF